MPHDKTNFKIQDEPSKFRNKILTMKKFTTYALLFGLAITAQSAFAYDEARDDGFADPTQSRLGRIYSEDLLQDAMKQRYYNYLRKKIRTNASKNRKSQYMRHIASRAQSNVNQKSTFLERDGELQDVPYYEDRRANSGLNTTVPNNPKRNFRVRAYDYYVEGGEAGKKALSENVINGQTHRVQRAFYNESGNKNYADILSQVRAAQRQLDKADQVPTGYQSKTTRRGDWRWNLMHPYMFSTEQE